MKSEGVEQFEKWSEWRKQRTYDEGGGSGILARERISKWWRREKVRTRVRERRNH